jgi:hypothetical protein
LEGRNGHRRRNLPGPVELGGCGTTTRRDIESSGRISICSGSELNRESAPLMS